MRFIKGKAILITLLGLFVACNGGKGDGEAGDSGEKGQAHVNIGVGPVKEMSLGELDPALAKKGKKIYESKCTSCHKFGERYVGPDLLGVTDRRSPEWIMNMILNPVEMTKKDETAKELLATYYTQMTNQNLDRDQARAILEYFRKKDKK